MSRYLIELNENLRIKKTKEIDELNNELEVLNDRKIMIGVERDAYMIVVHSANQVNEVRTYMRNKLDELAVELDELNERISDIEFEIKMLKLFLEGLNKSKSNEE